MSEPATEVKEKPVEPKQVEVVVGETCPFSNEPCAQQCRRADVSQGKTWCALWVAFQREMGQKGKQT